MANSELINTLSASEQTQLQPFIDLINQIMDLPEEALNEQTVQAYTTVILNSFTDAIREDTINATVNNFTISGFNRMQAEQSVNEAKQGLEQLLVELKPSKYQKIIIDSLFQDVFYQVFDKALERFHGFNITLPIKLEENAQIPTYAHDTDACADLYAAETIILAPHSLSNKIKTGVSIALPEGWMAMIFPRSSIGAKTELRLSNSVGIIDSDYRGELGILYDNFSDSEYTINAGDRIAQLMVLPSYHFKSEQVDILPTTERSEGGFGSTGK